MQDYFISGPKTSLHVVTALSTCERPAPVLYSYASATRGDGEAVAASSSSKLFIAQFDNGRLSSPVAPAQVADVRLRLSKQNFKESSIEVNR
ncbi:MAG: hypothetical protein E6R08_02470 [Nevskiaceae bacterium]|jgi:hypothetical protein|nr:MAG: hypothetical protein EKK33_06040 [Bradyrhizobiaceae bacterium]TXG99304.1 MAG: hypothetical protein E6R08_02470 [Nevskiaceae bacterium]